MINPMVRYALVLGLGILPLAVQASGVPGKGGEQCKAACMKKLAEMLKLTDSQKTQIEAIKARYAEAAKAKAQGACDAGKAFHEAVKKADTTAAQLKALYMAKAEKKFDLMQSRRAKHNEIRAILTPEQRIEWDKFQAFREGMKHGKRAAKSCCKG